MTMLRRILTITNLTTLTVLGSILAAGAAAAQNQGYSVWAHRNGGGTAPSFQGPRNGYDGNNGYGNYLYSNDLNDFSHYTDPYDAGYGGRLNVDFTVTKDRSFEAPLRPARLAAVSAAMIEVRLPDPQARVAFDGHPTASRGSQRAYATPPLKAGANYYYQVTATWVENGRHVQQDRKVKVRAGQAVAVDFTRDVYTATEAP
jgi:uncharacterized protein (TIGR03000 family)